MRPAIRLAERLIAAQDFAEPEVMLEFEVLDLSRSKLQELGLRFPDQIGCGVLQGSTHTTTLSGGISQTVTDPGGAWKGKVGACERTLGRADGSE